MKKVITKETFINCHYCKGIGTTTRKWVEGEHNYETGVTPLTGITTVPCSFCQGTKIIFSHKEVITEEEV